MFSSVMNIPAISSMELLLFLAVLIPCHSQREPSLPFKSDSFSRFLRFTMAAPPGRAANLDDIYIRFYGESNVTESSSYRLRDVSRLMDHPRFDMRKPTVLYSHGYAELSTDRSVHRVTRAYLRHGGYNTLLLDWANLAFGNYVTVALDVASIGKASARAVSRLIKQGLVIQNLHLVGHSLGAHVLAHTARALAAKGVTIPRLTGLDPAYPGFYPAALGVPLSRSDAAFVDVVHTDGGWFGAPARAGLADFWPNGGQAKQPGCLSVTVPFTAEDFCSHWRSWAFWAESVTGGQFVARRCDSYDTFLRGGCQNPPVIMGLHASPKLRGNFYLRTATKKPYALGITGAS